MLKEIELNFEKPELLVELPIQFFSENPESGEDGEGVNNNNENDEKLTLTKEELEKRIQSETDKRIDKALSTREENLRKKILAEIEESNKKAESLANLSEEEKLKKKLEDYEAEIERMKQETLKSKVDKEVIDELANRQLDVNLHSLIIVDYSDNAKNLEKINKLQEIINKQVEAEVKKRLTSSSSKPVAGGGTIVKQTITSKEQFNKLSDAEKIKLYKEDYETYKKFK